MSHNSYKHYVSVAVGATQHGLQTLFLKSEAPLWHVPCGRITRVAAEKARDKELAENKGKIHRRTQTHGAPTLRTGWAELLQTQPFLQGKDTEER